MNPSQQNVGTAAPEMPEARSPVGHTRVDAQNPWPGLDAYDEHSSKFFYGRSTEAAELLRLIRLSPLTVVYGRSGLGKTSLLQAGLFPLLWAQHYLPVLVRLDFAEGIKNPPLEQVKQHLRESLDLKKVEYPPIPIDESLWEYLHRKDAEFWSEDNFPVTPALVFDPFEELFSRTAGNFELIRQVFDGLADLIENRIPAELTSEVEGPRRSRLELLSQRYCIVLSFREDFLPEVKKWEKQVPSLLRSYLRLESMSRECAIETVILSGKTVLEDGEALSSALETLKQSSDETAKRSARAVLDAGVAASIVDLVGKRERQGDATDTPDMVIEPVLLSLCCTQLNRRRASGARIDKKLVENAGQDILESFYRDALEDPEVKGAPDAARFIEDYLIQGDRFRGDYPRQEALDEKKLRIEQLAALTDRHRLLRIVHRGDTARIELIHDRLVPVVRASRDNRRQREAAEQERAALLQAQEQERQALLKAKEDERLELERAYEREKMERAKIKLRRTRILMGAFAVLTLLALGTAGWALWEKQQGALAAKSASNSAERAMVEVKRAQLAGEQAIENALEAEHQSKIAQEAVDRIQQSLLIRQAALSGDQPRLNQLLSKVSQNRQIQFGVTATDLNRQYPDGSEIFEYRLFPHPETLPSGKNAVAFITYLADHPSFQNTLLTAGPNRKFSITYTGWGCLQRVVALAEYADPTKSATVTIFDMCKLLADK